MQYNKQIPCMSRFCLHNNYAHRLGCGFEYDILNIESSAPTCLIYFTVIVVEIQEKGHQVGDIACLRCQDMLYVT